MNGAFLCGSALRVEFKVSSWEARYNTWLLIQLMPKGVVFSFLFFSFLFFSFLFFSFLFFSFLFFSFLFFLQGEQCPSSELAGSCSAQQQSLAVLLHSSFATLAACVSNMLQL